MENLNNFKIKENPYTSDLFEKIWLKHYNHSKSAFQLNFINQIKFVKKKYFQVYISVGKNLTKGMSYILNLNGENDFKKKVFFIYDVPEYVKIERPKDNSSLKLIKVRQYKGFLANLKEFSSLDEYMADRFDSKSRYKIRHNMKRLKASLNVNDVFYFGNIPKDEYDLVFKTFYVLQQKRFKNKRLHSHFLEQWEYYNELVYPMILEKKASLYVLYHEKKPICISLHFHTDKIVLLSTTVFDLDYSKFSVGYMSIIKSIDWCIENNMDAYDFSKGYFHYKTRWSNLNYNFDLHIYYDSDSVSSTFMAKFIANLYCLKQFLRDKRINKRYNSCMFLIKNGRNPASIYQDFEIIDNPKFPQPGLLNEINYDDDVYENLRKPIFDFLFLKSESFETLKVYEHDGSYYFKGKIHNQKIKALP